MLGRPDLAHERYVAHPCSKQLIFLFYYNDYKTNNSPVSFILLQIKTSFNKKVDICGGHSHKGVLADVTVVIVTEVHTPSSATPVKAWYAKLARVGAGWLVITQQ